MLVAETIAVMINGPYKLSSVAYVSRSYLLLIGACGGLNEFRNFVIGIVLIITGKMK